MTNSKTNPQDIDAYLITVSTQIRTVISDILNTSPVLTDLLAELGSLGIVVKLNCGCDVQCIVRDDFVIPQQLSEDHSFEPEDEQWLDRIAKGKW